MSYFVYAALIGLLVGALVGLTGNGAGTLLLPLLILGLHVSPLVAVGSSVAFSFFTKIGAAWMHWRHENSQTQETSMGDIPATLQVLKISGGNREEIAGRKCFQGSDLKLLDLIRPELFGQP